MMRQETTKHIFNAIVFNLWAVAGLFLISWGTNSVAIGFGIYCFAQFARWGRE
jgi:hypothetical protein